MYFLNTIFVVLALASLVALIYPFKPFANRSYAAMLLAISIFGVGVIAPNKYVPTTAPKEDKIAKTNQPTKTDPGKNHPPIGVIALSDTSIPAPCGQGGLMLNDVVAVSGQHQIRLDPNLSSKSLKNEKASRILGKTHFHSIDNSTSVRRLCVQAEWSKIEIVSPDWLTHVSGWVENAALRVIEQTDDGARTYVADDFHWDNHTKPFKSEIITIVNRISRENKNCSVIDPYTVAKSGSRSTPNDPVFYVTCGSGANALNVWFRPGETGKTAKFKARTPIAKTAATDACEAAAKAAATHPSTVKFSRIWDLAYVPHTSGRARVVSSFTARNGFNLELKYRIDCLFDGPTLLETHIVEQ